MQPVKETVCHSVKEEATGHQRSKQDCPVGISHAAAPVDEDEQHEHYEDKKLAATKGDDHLPIEHPHDVVILAVQAEGCNKKNEGIKELYKLKSMLPSAKR